MSQRHLKYRALDNAFGWIADFQPAQKLADEFGVERLHRKLDGFADRYCPVVKRCGLIRWSSPPTSCSANRVTCRLSMSA